MKFRGKLFSVGLLLMLCGGGGRAVAQDIDGALTEPTNDGLAASVVIPSTAVDAGTAVPVFDFQVVNPAGASGLSVKIDRMTVTFSAGTAALDDLAGMKVTVTGNGSPVFTNTDNSLVTGGSDPISWTAVSGALVLGSTPDGGDDADLLAVASGDTVVVTVFVWLDTGVVIDGRVLSVTVNGVGDIATDTGGNTDLMASSTPQTTILIEQTALILTSTSTLSPPGLDSTLTVPSTATSKLVAVPVFEFKVRDDDDGVTPRPTRIDGLTLSISLGGGMDVGDIAGATLVVASSEPANTTVFSATVGGDREINTADDPNFLKLVTAGSGLELRAGLATGTAGAANNGIADLLELADSGTATDQTVTLMVKIWLENSGITGNSTATFDLRASGVLLDTGGNGTDVINSNEDLANGVATFIVASNENTTLADRSTVPNVLTLPSSASSQATAIDVFDFSIADGIGGQATKIDSLTIPVTFSGGAAFGDLAGARLRIDNGADIAFAEVGGRAIDTGTNPALVRIDSIGANQALLSFKGKVAIDTTDAVADLLEIPDGGMPVAFTVSVWIDTADIAYGATFAFDLQNRHVTLSGQNSDGLAKGQDVTDGVVSIGVTRLIDSSTVGDTVTVSTGNNAASAAVSVFDFKIVDPTDGKPTLIDAIAIPISAGDGGRLSNIAGATLNVQGLSDNSLAGSGGMLSTADGDGVSGGTIDPLELNEASGQLEAGVGAGGFADIGDNAGNANLLSIGDGETAILTVAIWVYQAGVIDGSTLTFDIRDLHIDVDDQDGVTDVFASAQDVTDGVITLRTATLANYAAVEDSVYVSTSQQIAPGTAVFDFQIVDPADGKPTVIDGIFIPWVFTGAALADIGEVTVTVVVGGTAASIADDVRVGGDDDGIVVSGTDNSVIALGGGGIELGSDGTVGSGGAVGNGDGAAGFLMLGDGQTAVVSVQIHFTGGAPPTDGETVAFDLQTAHLAVDSTAGLSGGIGASQDVADGLLLVTGATSQLSDNAGVANSVILASTAIGAENAVAVFDFTIRDLSAAAGGTNSGTLIDGITIPIALSGMEFADVAGARVEQNGSNFAEASDSGGGGNLITGGDVGIELVDTGNGGAELRLGSATSGVATDTSEVVADLFAVTDGRPVIVTVFLWLNASGIDDNATLTFSLDAGKFEHERAETDLIVERQRVTRGVAKIEVVASKLAFIDPAAENLAANGVSDTVKVVAIDGHGNIDRDYAANIAVSTSTQTGQFSQNGSSFLGTNSPLSATPTSGVLSLFYKDSDQVTATLAASSGSLKGETFNFSIQALTVSVVWINPAVGDTTTTDSAGTFQRLQYAVTSNDPNLMVEFWVAQSATLPAVTPQNANPLTVFNPSSSRVLGRLRNPTGGMYGPGSNKEASTDVPIGVDNQFVYTSGLSAGTWYVYMVRADGDGVSAGGDTLARSGALNVVHQPDIIAFGVVGARDGRIDAGTSFSRDSGGNNPNAGLNLLLYAEDHNSNDEIRLYISTNPGLTDSTIVADTSGTYRIAGTTNWMTDDVGDTLRYASVTISDSLGSSSFHPQGIYYFYALVLDSVDSTAVAFARAQNLAGAQQSMMVSHSPTLTFSTPRDPVRNHSIAAEPELILSWNGSGAAGDRDIDDNASISLWFAPADSTPDTFADTSESWLRKIVSGLAENPDGGVNDQYAWDLTRFDGQLPRAGTPIKVWALLQDGGPIPVFIATPPIDFAPYEPSLFLLNPPPGAVTEIRENEAYRFAFDADYVSDVATNGTVRYFISSRDTTSLEAVPTGFFTFDTGASSSFPENYNSFWISGERQLKEGIDRFFDWTPKEDGNNYAVEIVPQTAATTTFHLYAVINTSSNAITSPHALKLARAPAQIRINGLGTTSTDPAAVASPSQGELAVGDTVRLLLMGNTNGTVAQGVQFYVNLDSTQFAVVDQDSSQTGIQPFGFAENYFFGTVATQINRIASSATTYKLDLDKRNLSAPEDPTGRVVAHIDLVARSFTGAAYVNWNLDNINDPNRIPLFFNAGGVLSFEFSNPLATFQGVNRGIISGTVPLQGANRTSDSKVTTFWLRSPGNWISVVDTAFVNANDDSSAVEGVQLSTGADGSFTLSRVPPGQYELVTKTESYLSGYAPVAVVNGQTLTGVVPTRVTTDGDSGQLLGGDITGDNKIDADDESALNLAYESAATDSSFNSAADIDDDGIVLLSDLLILAANMRTPLLTGVAPVYKTAIDRGAALVLSGIPLEVTAGEEFEVDLVLEGVRALAGYSLGLEFDPEILEVVAVETPFLENYPAVRIGRQKSPGWYVLAEGIKGGGEAVVDDPLLARVRFRVLEGTRSPLLGVERAYLADRSGRQMELSARTARALPERFALWQNAPNPFNPSTQITFDLPEEGAWVELTIFNVMGQPIRHLLRARGVSAGRYRLTWDGRDDMGRLVGSGVYLYALRAGDFAQSRKLLLMK